MYDPLAQVPDEILLHVLSFLDIPELLNVSRTSHHLRHLSLDPILHIHRLHRVSLTLERCIPIRPSLAELMQHRIYITRTTLAARNLGRNLIKIKLNRSLSHRPSLASLVSLNILPSETLSTPALAPSLISTKRLVERERVKDTLRRFLEDWGKKGRVAAKEGRAEEKIDVRRMARRLVLRGDGAVKREETRWGGRREGRRREEPTRAKVLGLRRFWEGVGRDVTAGGNA